MMNEAAVNITVFPVNLSVNKDGTELEEEKNTFLIYW